VGCYSIAVFGVREESMLIAMRMDVAKIGAAVPILIYIFLFRTVACILMFR